MRSCRWRAAAELAGVRTHVDACPPCARAHVRLRVRASAHAGCTLSPGPWEQLLSLACPVWLAVPVPSAAPPPPPPHPGWAQRMHLLVCALFCAPAVVTVASRPAPLSHVAADHRFQRRWCALAPRCGACCAPTMLGLPLGSATPSCPSHSIWR